MADSSCDHNFYKGICKGKNDYKKFIFECGIVSFNTDPKLVINLKNIVNQYSHR